MGSQGIPAKENRYPVLQFTHEYSKCGRRISTTAQQPKPFSLQQQVADTGRTKNQEHKFCAIRHETGEKKSFALSLELSGVEHNVVKTTIHVVKTILTFRCLFYFDDRYVDLCS